jgi:hypothetical protein
MIVHVDLAAAPPAVTLQDAEDLRAFKVVTTGGEDPAALAGALQGVGRVAPDGHAFIDPDAVRRLAGDRDAPWRESFAQMLAYAHTKGWLDADGAIQAHVEHE